MFINIHSHSPAGKREFVLQNLHHNFNEANKPGFFSVGIHPWYIQEDTWLQQLQEIKVLLGKKNVLALGECGLDRVCKTDFELQKAVFISQVQLANQFKKPLIIHCVRAHEDVLLILKEIPAMVPVIFHGFNNKLAVAQKILMAGHWLSFGKALQQPGMKAVLLETPLNKIFLETDDATLLLGSIYAEAAAVKNMTVDELSLQIEHNFQTVFNRTV